jgi:hypothetical protein
MTNQNVDGMCAYLSTFSSFSAFIWKVGSGSGSASKLKVGSGTTVQRKEKENQLNEPYFSV